MRSERRIWRLFQGVRLQRLAKGYDGASVQSAVSSVRGAGAGCRCSASAAFSWSAACIKRFSKQPRRRFRQLRSRGYLESRPDCAVSGHNAETGVPASDRRNSGRQDDADFSERTFFVDADGGRSKSNYVEAARPILIPDATNPYEGFKFTTEPPLGEGLLVAILSAEPLQSIPLPDAPQTMDQTEALEYFARLTNELGRNLQVSGNARPRDWSFATKSYRIVQ